MDPRDDNTASRRLSGLLSSMVIFETLNAEELQVVARQMRLIQLNPEEILFREGDPGNFLCFIIDGSLDVLKSGPSGEVLITTLQSGQSIGEMAVVDSPPRSATVKARTAVQLAILSGSAFDMILEKPSRIGIKVLKSISRLLSRHLRETSNRLAEFMPPLG